MSAPPLDELLAAAPLPAASGDKRDRGSVVVVGGSPGCPGGAVLAAVAALRAGAGRVQLAVNRADASTVAATFPEAFVTGWDHGGEPVPDDLAKRLGRAAVVVVGPGLLDGGRDTALAVAELVPDGVPLLLDAAALEATADLAADRDRCLVVAPNDTEARRIAGADDADPAAALEACLGGRPSAVRGVQTLVLDGRGGRWLHRADVDGLGTAGSGDVFAGIAAAFLARGADPLTATAWAVAVHGRAGARAAEDIGTIGFLAREVADRIPAVLPHD